MQLKEKYHKILYKFNEPKNMKNIITIIAVLLFVSCSSEDEEVLQPTDFGIYVKTTDNSEITFDYTLSSSFDEKNNPLKEGTITFTSEDIISFPNYANINSAYIEINLKQGDYSKFESFIFVSNKNMYFKYNDFAIDNKLAKSIFEINKISNINESYYDVGFNLDINFANGEWIDKINF